MSTDQADPGFGCAAGALSLVAWRVGVLDHCVTEGAQSRYERCAARAIGGREWPATPLMVWGPSGATPEMGTKYAVEHFLKAYTWDARTRNFRLNPGPGNIEVSEFDCRGENQVVYQENGVTIRSWPSRNSTA